ncbi:MAG: hypothetical protein PHX62_04250 [Bacilli bacterium]|nr:hypothetical protein [Bacilli bacterium]
MSDNFNNYLNYCLGNPITEKCAIIKLKIYQDSLDEKIAQEIKNEYDKIKDCDCFVKYAFLIGYDWHFKQMKDFYAIYNEFREKREFSLAYAQACFLFLQTMNEMMYDEYRSLMADLDAIIEVLIQNEFNQDIALLLIASLYYNYLNPKYRDYLQTRDFDFKLFQDFKGKLEKRFPLW